jgi:hypothetical protein
MVCLNHQNKRGMIKAAVASVWPLCVYLLLPARHAQFKVRQQVWWGSSYEGPQGGHTAWLGAPSALLVVGVQVVFFECRNAGF